MSLVMVRDIIVCVLNLFYTWQKLVLFNRQFIKYFFFGYNSGDHSDHFLFVGTFSDVEYIEAVRLNLIELAGGCLLKL